MTIFNLLIGKLFFINFLFRLILIYFTIIIIVEITFKTLFKIKFFIIFSKLFKLLKEEKKSIKK